MAMASVETRLRQRIDVVTEQRNQARQKCDELARKLARLHRCGFCGQPAELGVCAAHSDLERALQ